MKKRLWEFFDMTTAERERERESGNSKNINENVRFCN